jgi:hypothetical protein
MYRSKEYNTLRTVAEFTSGFGWVIVGGLFFIGLVVGANISAGGIFVGILFGLLFGIMFGIPLVVGGQTVSVFLDQKELLEEILKATKWPGEGNQNDVVDTENLHEQIKKLKQKAAFHPWDSAESREIKAELERLENSAKIQEE